MKYKKPIKEYICFILAFIIAFFIVEANVVVPSQNLIEQCETTLHQYLNNPQFFSPANDVEISIKGTTITASIPFSFVHSTATQTTDGTYEIESKAKIVVFTFTQIILLIALSCSLYAIFCVILHMSTFIYKKFSTYLKYFTNFINKQVRRLLNYFKKRKLQKSLKEYEDPKLKEVYQLGYNIGYANGFADGIAQSETLSSYPYDLT